MRFFRHLISWALALFLIFMFVQATFHPLPNPPEGSVKFLDLPGDNIVFQTLATRSGIPIFEPTIRTLTGMMEVLAAFLLFLPFTRRLGAVLATLILGGAVAFHMSPWLGREIPVSLNPANTATDGGALFTLAIVMLVSSLLLLAVHPSRRGRN